MDSRPRVALLVDVAAVAEVCERIDDSLIGCLQLLREIQSENGGEELAMSYSLFDSSRGLDPRQLQEFLRQQSYRAQKQQSKEHRDVACISPWQTWDMGAWVKLRKHKEFEIVTSPAKFAFASKENLPNQQTPPAEPPVIRRCLPLVDTSSCKSKMYICVLGLLPSAEDTWREWAGLSRSEDRSVLAADVVTALSTDVAHPSAQWRFVDCKGQRGAQAALQSSAHGAARLFSSCLNAKGLSYDLLCTNNFVAAPAVASVAGTARAATIPTCPATVASYRVGVSLHGVSELVCDGDWRPIRRKAALQRLVMYAVVDASQLERCCLQSLGKLHVDDAAMVNWVGTLRAMNLAAVAIAAQDHAETSVWLHPVSQSEFQVSAIRVGSGQTPLLANAVKQSTLFASNPTLLSLMRPPPPVMATLSSTTKRAPLQQHEQQDEGSGMRKARASRGLVLLKRSDSVVSGSEMMERAEGEIAVDAQESLAEIDAALNLEAQNCAAQASEALSLMDDPSFASELGPHLAQLLQHSVLGTCAKTVESCLLRGQCRPLVAAQELVTSVPTDKLSIRQVSDALLSVFAPITKKFMGRCSRAERALLARCNILQLLYLFESALTSRKSGKSNPQELTLSKSARGHASKAIVKLATNLNAPDFDESKMLFSDSMENSNFGSVQLVCSYLNRQYGDSFRSTLDDICSEVSDSYSKPKAETTVAAAAPVQVQRPTKLRLLPDCDDSDDGQQQQCGVAEALLPDDQDSNWFSVLSQGSDTNMSDSVSKVRKRLFDDATTPGETSKVRKSYPPTTRTPRPAVTATAQHASGEAPSKLQELMARAAAPSRGGFAASRQQVGAYQVMMHAKSAAQSKLKRSHSLPARSRELLARSQAAAAQMAQQPSPQEQRQPATIAETPIIKRRRS